MGAQHWGNIGIVQLFLLRRTDRENIKSVLSISIQEAIDSPQFFGQPVDLFDLFSVSCTNITSEDDEFPFGVGRNKVVKFVGARIGGSNEYVCEHPHSDYQTVREGLMFRFHDVWYSGYRGGRIVDTNARGKSSESLEGSEMGIRNSIKTQG